MLLLLLFLLNFVSAVIILPTRLHSLHLQALYRCICWAVWACWRWCQVAVKGRPLCCRATVPETPGPSWGAAKGCMDGAARSAGRHPARWMNFLVSVCVRVCVCVEPYCSSVVRINLVRNKESHWESVQFQAAELFLMLLTTDGASNQWDIFWQRNNLVV